MTSTRANVSAMIRNVQSGEDYIIQRSGKPVAIVLPYEKYEGLMEEVMASDPHRNFRCNEDIWQKGRQRAIDVDKTNISEILRQFMYRYVAGEFTFRHASLEETEGD
jgi:prevent-host-death family protein